MELYLSSEELVKEKKKKQSSEMKVKMTLFFRDN